MKKVMVIIVMLALIPTVNVYGAMVKLDLDTLWAESDSAVLGTVTGIETCRGARGMIYRIIIINVEDHFIQTSDSTTVRVRIEGGEIGSTGVWVEDQPEISIGEHVFLFLYAPDAVEGDYDFLVYGSVQGKFIVNGEVAKSITGESFTIPEPEDTIREDTIPIEEKEQNELGYDIDAFVVLGSVIVLIGAPLTLWSLSGKQIIQ